MMRNVLRLAVVSFAAACASTPAPVPVLGTPSETSRLAGQWSGEYRSPETGRSGLITFNLTAGQDTALGDVIMMPRDQGRPRMDPAPPGTTMRPMSQVLTIRFVRVMDRTVSGTIAPYRSPDCDCLLRTIFRGEIRGDRIAGDFITEHATDASVRQRGTWSASRQKPPDGP